MTTAAAAPTAPANQSHKSHFEAMVRVATSMGCELEQNKQDRMILTGACPFHTGKKNGAGRTLTINSRTCLFSCEACESKGNTYTFCALAWRVSTKDAHMLLQHHGNQVTAARPAYPEPEENEQAEPKQLNTAVLTRAMDHFKRMLPLSYETIAFLAKLQVKPEQAIATNAGYCNGSGLRESLLNSGVTERELAATPLFDHITGAENLAGRMVIADTDYTGACIWMTSISPDQETLTAEFPGGRPNLYGIPGIKPEMLNLYGINQQERKCVITDDARLYLVLKAEKYPAALITPRHGQEPATALQSHSGRYAKALARKNPRRITLALHSHRLGGMIRARMKRLSPHCLVTEASEKDIMEQVEPKTRNLSLLTRQAPERPPAVTLPERNRTGRPPAPPIPGSNQSGRATVAASATLQPQ